MIATRELSTEELWHAVASALNELHARDECPRLEEWRAYRGQSAECAPGIRRSPEVGEWVRRVQWSSSAGKWVVVNSDPLDAVGHAESIADHAREAYTIAQRRCDISQIPSHLAGYAKRAALRLAAILGIDFWDVRIDQRWGGGLGPVGPLTLTVNGPGGDPSSYSFSCLDPRYGDEPFYLLGPCPECRAMVPMVEVQQLADLGAHLVNGTSLFPSGDGEYHAEFAEDSRHSSGCPHGPM